MSLRRLSATRIVTVAAGVLVWGLVTGVAISGAGNGKQARAAKLKVDRIVVKKSARRMTLLYRKRRWRSSAAGSRCYGNETSRALRPLTGPARQRASSGSPRPTPAA